MVRVGDLESRYETRAGTRSGIDLQTSAQRFDSILEALQTMGLGGNEPEPTPGIPDLDP
jgi:hypothetical protein